MENNLEQILSTVTSNPELMKKISDVAKSGKEDAISEVMSLISPIVSEKKEPHSDEISSEEKAEDKSALLASSSINSIGKSISKNKGLLLALKPYLSKERCEMIDHVVKLSQIADVMKLI